MHHLNTVIGAIVAYELLRDGDAHELQTGLNAHVPTSATVAYELCWNIISHKHLRHIIACIRLRDFVAKNH